MKRAILGLGMLGVAAAIVLGAARGASYEPPNPAVYGPKPMPGETTGEVLYWVVRGCAEGGGRWVQGIEDGVLVGHCTPAALPHLGVVAVPARRRGR